MKKIIYLMVFLLLSIASNTVVAQTIVFKYITNNEENSGTPIKVVLENNQEYYPNSEGVITITGLSEGQTYASKVYIQYYDKKLKKTVERSINNPTVRADNQYTLTGDSGPIECNASGDDCRKTVYIHL